VASVDTTGYWRDSSVSPTGTGYHYNHNAETFLLTGDALGRAMIDLQIPDTTAPTPDPMTWALAPTPGGATPILSTDFSGRTVSGDTASNITWTTNGVLDPGAITALDIDSAAPGTFELFDTADAQGYFVPNLNLSKEGPWSTSLTLNLTIPEISLENVVLDRRNFENSGTFRPLGKERAVLWTVTVTGSISGQLDSVQLTSDVTLFGTETIVFASPLTLTNAESYEVMIRADAVGTLGNNAGLAGLTLNGDIGTPVGSATFIRMFATLATDPSGVEYYFTCIEDPAHDSGWQDGTFYTDTGLTPETQYTYTVKARDKSIAQNETAASAEASATTGSSCSTCGDIDGSGGNVDMADFAEMSKCWGVDPTVDSSCVCANLVEASDNIIDLLDLQVLAELFLSTSSDYPPDCSTP
jgi:hypothetical protein